METSAKKAAEAAHLAIIAASYRISGARLGHIWGLEESTALTRGARLSTNRREIRSSYAEKHLKTLEMGNQIAALFPLPQKGSLTNCARVLSCLMGGNEIGCK